MSRAALLAPALLLASACGLREPLEPAPGQSMPPAPAQARSPLTVDEMLTPPPIARPERVDELLRRSERREEDRFDLPPPDVPAGEPPVATDADDDEGQEPE